MHRWFFPGTAVSSRNKTHSNDISYILLKLALNVTTLTLLPHPPPPPPKIATYLGKQIVIACYYY